MTDIDEKIREALANEDAAQIKELEHEAGLFELVNISFHGKQAWLTYASWIYGFAAFGVGVYAFTRFLAEPDIKTSLAWLIGVIACMMVLAISKIMAWQQLHRLALMREIKRLELRLLSLMDDKRA